jgi:hypothetical protein
MRNILFFSLFSLICTLGCGGEGYNVGGKVTFPDGSPVPHGQVTFISDNFSAGGSIIAEGSYSISIRVPAGTYKVGVRASGEPVAAPGADVANMKIVPLVDPKYGNPETSGLVVEVKGPTTFNIGVERPQ